MIKEIIAKAKGKSVIEGDHWILQDNTIVATFPYEYGDQIKKLLHLARIHKDSGWLLAIHNGMHKKLTDRYIIPNVDFEPIEVVHKVDKVTMEGMEVFNKNIMVQSATRLSFMAVGSGIAQTYAAQQELQSEVARASLDNSGFLNAEGLFLLWENVFDTLTPSFACGEVGIFDSMSGGTMAARGLLGQTVTHDYGNDWLYVQFFISTMSS